MEQAHSEADSRPSNFEYRLGPAGAIGGVDTSGDGGYTWVSKDLFSDELIWMGIQWSLWILHFSGWGGAPILQRQPPLINLAYIT